MRRILILLLILLITATNAGRGGPVKIGEPVLQQQVFRLGGANKVVAFKKNELARVAVYGARNAHLGLYVFDSHGNCICKDDEAEGNNLSGCAVQWFPATTQEYHLELRNFGPLTTRLTWVIR